MQRICLLLCLLIATAAYGSDWTLIQSDFQKQAVTLTALDDTGLTIVTDGGVQPVRLPLEQFLSIDRNQPASIGQTSLVLHLAGGGRLVGTPLRLDGDNIIWRTRTIGEVPASLRQARGITRGPVALPPSADLRQDRIRLANGDALEGIVADVADDNLIVQVGTDAVAVSLESIASVEFASTGRAASGDQPGFQLRLADGSVVAASQVRIAGNEAEVEIGGAARRIPLAGVLAVEQVNGPVAWLSDRTPGEVVHVPFLGESIQPRFNTDLAGRPIRLGNDRISKAIAVHTRSQLTWELPDGFGRFRTRYAIDGDLPHANVTVRILLDGKVVHEQADVVSGPAGAAVEIDLNGAKRLTLQADYGRTYDVQDRLIWIEPALLR